MLLRLQSAIKYQKIEKDNISAYYTKWMVIIVAFYH